MSLFKLDKSYDYDNEVYLEEGYYNFNEIADWILENLDVLNESKKKSRADKARIRAAARANTLQNRKDQLAKTPTKVLMINDTDSHTEHMFANNRAGQRTFGLDKDKKFKVNLKKYHYTDPLTGKEVNFPHPVSYKTEKGKEKSDKWEDIDIVDDKKHPNFVRNVPIQSETLKKNHNYKNHPYSNKELKNERENWKTAGGMVSIGDKSYPQMVIRKKYVPGTEKQSDGSDFHHQTFDHENGHVEDFKAAYLHAGKKGVRNMAKNNSTVSSQRDANTDEFRSAGKGYDRNYMEYNANLAARIGTKHPQVLANRDRMVRAMTKGGERGIRATSKLYNSVSNKEYDKAKEKAQGKKSNLGERMMKNKNYQFIDKT